MNKNKVLNFYFNILLIFVGTIYFSSHFDLVKLSEETTLTIASNDVLENNILSCYNSVSTSFTLSNEYYSIADSLEEYNGSYSIVFKELDDDFSVVDYNTNYEFYGESIVKLAYAIYIYDYLIDDKEEFDTVLKYKSSYYKTGSGVIRYTDLTNASFTIRELLYYMVEDSDNIAFFMLIDYFGVDAARDYWSNLGTNLTFGGWDYFGLLDGSDATVYLNRLYEIIESGDPYYDDLIESSKAASKNSILQETFKADMYFKYGGVTSCYHEIAIVDDGSHPYMISVLSSLSNTDRFTLFPDIAKTIEELHNMYWKEKYDYCSLGV